MALLLRTRVEIVYEGTDITLDVAPDLLSFSYTDNDGGKADDITLSLKNDHGRWHGPWLPARGDKLRATIVQEGEGQRFALPCGAFTIDEIEASGPPSVVSIKGASMPTESDITRRKQSRAWENVRLSEIVRDVARAGLLAANYLIKDDPLYERRDQRDETDLTFLRRLCSDEGFSLKCTDEQLVVFDPRELSEADPVLTIVYGRDNIKGWRFTAQNHDVYKSCTLEYYDPKKGKYVKYTYKQPGMETGKTKKLQKYASSKAEAERIAKAALYEANRNEVTGSLEMVGDTRLVAGATVAVVGFGRFDGKYFIRSATHNVASGYTTSVELSNTREEAEEKPTVFNTPKARRSDGLEDILGE